MKWYYAEGGKQIGPVEESALDDLVRQGVVRDDTLVWREGMAAWQRHGAVRGSSSPSPGNAPPPPQPAYPPMAAAAATPGADVRYCSECGRAVPASQLISFGNVSVCTQCQPAYSQRLGGAGQGAGRRFGGFWIRFLAIVIDAIILWVATLVIRIPLGLLGLGAGLGLGSLGRSPDPAQALVALPAIMSLIGLSIIDSVCHFPGL